MSNKTPSNLAADGKGLLTRDAIRLRERATHGGLLVSSSRSLLLQIGCMQTSLLGKDSILFHRRWKPCFKKEHDIQSISSAILQEREKILPGKLLKLAPCELIPVPAWLPGSPRGLLRRGG